MKLNKAQRRLFRMVAPRSGEYDWATKFLAFWAANQIGKTLGLAILLLWAAWNKIGVPVPGDGEEQRWLETPYEWYHLSPNQEQAYLPYKDIVLLLEGTHPAQLDRETKQYRPMRIPEGLVRTVTLEHYYDGLELWNGSHIHFRTTAERAKALQGRRAAGISFDEAAFETHLIEIIDEVLLMRLIASGGPLFVVSTPDGINDFFELVQKLQDSGDHPEFEGEIDERVWVNEYGEVLIYADIYDNLGFGVTQEEIDRRERSDSPAKEQTLRGAFLNPSEAFFVPSDRVTQAFDHRLPEFQPPMAGRAYVSFTDPSVASDPAALIVIDTTDPENMRGVYMRYWPDAVGVDDLIAEIEKVHTWYGNARHARTLPSTCTSGWDSVGMGGHIFTHLLGRIRPRHPVDISGSSKKKIDMLTNFRTLMLTGRLKFPKSGPWLRLMREVMNYRLDDTKIQQDAVMAAAGAALLTKGKGGNRPRSRTFRTGATVAARGRF